MRYARNESLPILASENIAKLYMLVMKYSPSMTWPIYNVGYSLSIIIAIPDGRRRRWSTGTGLKCRENLPPGGCKHLMTTRLTQAPHVGLMLPSTHLGELNLSPLFAER